MYQRGDVVICVLSGDYGKPRPAVVVQSDLFNPTHASITVCPITTYVMDAPLFRLPIEPSSENGLRSSSQIMVDKISTLKVEKVRQKIGSLHAKQIVELNKALKLWLDI
ncbi:MAG: type II toxin-antitoxin system PemK/MazF family toxin [Gammaproteobacteria bacterium]|nr:type II toxin-antitoxin system PemK/MazF family toxin [Gammaproteobacteria bacterium]